MQSRVRNRTERTQPSAEVRIRREREAAMRVRELRADLMLAAEHGTLSNEAGFKILTDHLNANATLPEACMLISITREIAAETDARTNNPAADCANPWAQTNTPSCPEVVLLGVEQRIADALAKQLANGPWPI